MRIPTQLRRFKPYCALLTIVLFTVLQSACRQRASTDRFSLVIGSRGHVSGKFNRPRGIYYDIPRKLLHVVDWDGRIQSFTKDGKFRGSWIMPEVKKGKPEDLCVTPEGTILVTDTHYSRIIEFTHVGKEVRRFGNYGGGDGQFIYPVGICMDADGFIYVSEYGDNNRVQKFTREGEYIASFGKYGNGPGEFIRPSGMAIGPDGNLYVTDAVNHRVEVFTRDGKFLREIGGVGKEPGQFNYPYDLVFRGKELLVLEFGNNRVQSMTLEGESIRIFGSAGNGDGQFASPWRFCVVGDDVYVSDTNNFRVVKLADF